MFHRMREHIRIQSTGIGVFQHSTDRVKSEFIKLLDKIEHGLIFITTRLYHLHHHPAGSAVRGSVSESGPAQAGGG